MATSARIDDLRKKFDENPRRYFAPLANEYRKAGDLAQAITICRQHLADQPGHMSGHIVYGQALFENKEYDEAQKVFTAALALDPENLIALRLLGDIARDGGDYTAANTWYQRVLDADPRNEDIQAQLKLVKEALERAAAEAALNPPPVEVSTPTPRVSPLEPAPVALSPSPDASTIEIPRVSPPRAAPVSELPLPDLTADDFAPPRLSIMGLDLESMARVADVDGAATLVPSASQPDSEFETSQPFNASQFDGDLETDANPLAGISGIEIRDETSAASLTPRSAPPVDEFVITPRFGASEAPPVPADLPAELHMPSRVTPPMMELGLAPQPKPEPTGLWDTLEELEAEQTAQTGASVPNFEPRPHFDDAAPPAALEPDEPAGGAFDLIESPASEASAGAASDAEPFVTETMGDVYVQQGHLMEALVIYRQLLAVRPGDPALLGKIAALETGPVAASGNPRVRDFFASLAGWRSGQVAVATAMVAADSLVPAAAEAAQETASTVTAPESVGVESWMTARAFDLGVFANAAVTEGDERAARRLAAMYPDRPLPGHAETELDPVAPDAPVAVVELPGQPARPASGVLSLDQVFSDSAPMRPSRKSASFSFDQFFSQTAQVAASPRSPTPAAAAPAQPSPEEAEQFQKWLKGLKGS